MQMLLPCPGHYKQLTSQMVVSWLEIPSWQVLLLLSAMGLTCQQGFPILQPWHGFFTQDHHHLESPAMAWPKCTVGHRWSTLTRWNGRVSTCCSLHWNISALSIRFNWVQLPLGVITKGCYIMHTTHQLTSHVSLNMQILSKQFMLFSSSAQFIWHSNML